MTPSYSTSSRSPSPYIRAERHARRFILGIYGLVFYLSIAAFSSIESWLRYPPLLVAVGTGCVVAKGLYDEIVGGAHEDDV